MPRCPSLGGIAIVRPNDIVRGARERAPRLDFEGRERRTEGGGSPVLERLAYLVVREAPAGGIQGAVLVTDAQTRPLEFRVTEVLRPTALQRALHGAMHDEVAVGDLIGRALLAALREEPGLVLVRDPRLLAAASDDGPPLLLLGCDEALQSAASRLPACVSLDGQATGAALLGGRVDSLALEAWRAALRPLAEVRDLDEPFARLAQALDVVDEERRTSGKAAADGEA